MSIGELGECREREIRVREGLEGRAIVSGIGEPRRGGGVKVKVVDEGGGNERGEGDRMTLRTTGEVNAEMRSSAGGRMGEDMERVGGSDQIGETTLVSSFCHSGSAGVSSSSSMSGRSVGSSSDSKLSW